MVLVDDVQQMGTSGYPALDELALPGYSFEVFGSVARLAPETRS